MAKILIDHKGIESWSRIHTTAVGRIVHAGVHSLFLWFSQVSSLMEDILNFSDFLLLLKVLIFDASNSVFIQLSESVKLIHRDTVVYQVTLTSRNIWFLVLIALVQSLIGHLLMVLMLVLRQAKNNLGVIVFLFRVGLYQMSHASLQVLNKFSAYLLRSPKVRWLTLSVEARTAERSL